MILLYLSLAQFLEPVQYYIVLLCAFCTHPNEKSPQFPDAVLSCALYHNSILYAVYLHQRMRMNWKGKRMVWFAVIAVFCVLFTFAGVNKLLPGLHSYAV